MKNKRLKIALFGVMLAIEAIFCFTPLGSLPTLGPVVMTLMMIPVMITGIYLGAKAGSLMGFFAGLFSFIVWTFMPPNPLVAFLFTPFFSSGIYQGSIWSLVICFGPRILSGTAAGLLYDVKNIKNKSLRAGIAGIASSLTNTFGVLLGSLVFFGATYGFNLAWAWLLLLTNGIPETILSGLLTMSLTKALDPDRYKNR